MKVKLKGELFKHPMEYNHISIEGDKIAIHNSDNEVGFMQNFKNKVMVADPIEFTLNKKNYKLLSTFEDFYVEKNGNAITIITHGFRGKFADLGVDILKPDLSNLTDLGVSYADVSRGKHFATKPSEGQIQYDGISILSDRIVASDSFCIYQKEIENLGAEINIPKEIFPYLGNENYTIKSNGKLVVFATEKYMFYAKIIAVLCRSMKLDYSGIVEFKTNKYELLEKLKIAGEYSNGAQIYAGNEELKIVAANNENQVDLIVPIIPVNLKSLEYGVHVRQLIKMVSAMDTDDITIKADDRMIKCVDEEHKIINASARVGAAYEVIGG